jgi:hypothetical protein
MLALNPKCLVFSGALVSAYMWLPCRYDTNWPTTVAGIALASYVSLAWYDELYSCEDRMRVGATSYITGPFKPTVVNGRYGD